MLSLIAICNKSSFVRSTGCLLMVESGKLRRLLVKAPTTAKADNSLIKTRNLSHSLSDILYQHKETIQESLATKLCAYYSFTGEGFMNLAYFRQLL